LKFAAVPRGTLPAEKSAHCDQPFEREDLSEQIRIGANPMGGKDGDAKTEDDLKSRAAHL